MKNNKNSVAPETYNDLRDYMEQNGYQSVAILEENHTEYNEELYGTTKDDVNYTLNVIDI